MKKKTEILSPEDIVKKSKYGANALIEEQDKIVEALVQTWNKIIDDFENKTIMFSIRVKQLCKGFPDKTISELIDKVRNHPELKHPAHSKDRIMQGLRLVNERPDLLEYKENKKISFADKPYVKKDGAIFWEFYFQLYKYNLDPGIRKMLEDKGKDQLWSVRKLKAEIGKMLDEKRDPNTCRRLQKAELIKESIIMFKQLDPDDIKNIMAYGLKKYKAKLEKYLEWKEEKDKDE